MMWEYEKFNGDMALYAFCKSCNYHHADGKYNFKNQEWEVYDSFRFCPICGTPMNHLTEDYTMIWNERDLMDLLNPDGCIAYSNLKDEEANLKDDEYEKYHSSNREAKYQMLKEALSSLNVSFDESIKTISNELSWRVIRRIVNKIQRKKVCAL